MYPILIGVTALVSARQETPVQTFARLEYGERDGTWLTAPRPDGESRTERLARRLRYWLNSFRGFAIYDVRGVDDRTRA